MAAALEQELALVLAAEVAVEQEQVAAVLEQVPVQAVEQEQVPEQALEVRVLEQVEQAEQVWAAREQQAQAVAGNPLPL